MSKWLFTVSYVCFFCILFQLRLLLTATGSPTAARATVPRPPHTAALGVPGERIAADARLGKWGAWRGALPRTDRSLTGKGVDPRQRRDLPTLQESFPSRVRCHTNFNIIMYKLTST